jgi:hypothetical protein
MKTRAEHAELLCKAVDKWFSDRYGNDSVPPATVWAALNAWRYAQPDKPHENKWAYAAFNALQRMKNVRDNMSTIEEVIVGFELEIKSCRSVPEDTPDPPELKITPGPMILSPSDRLSEEDVWMRALEAATYGQWHGATNIANHVLDAFRERFRKEKK